MTKVAAYLERYMAGEHEQVWADLQALGAQVRDDAVYADALAVARETMRRARHNIEALIPRFERVGYRFGYDWLEEDELDFAEGQPPVFAPPAPDARERIAELEALAGTLPLSLRAWYETVGAVNFVGMPPDGWGVVSSGVSAAFADFLLSYPSAEEAQRFMGEHPGLDESLAHDVGLDPLQVLPIEEQVKMVRAERARLSELKEAFEDAADGREAEEGDDEERAYARLQREGKVLLTIAPDHWLKYNISGSGPYEIAVPDTAADGRLFLEWHRTTFVNYLRLCFRWGGLPGLERAHQVPARDLAFLTEGLLPL